jgi:hypothetical protein
LLAHAPDQARWLAVADPESLVGYSSTITSPQTRALLVDGLLQRADRIELADRSWQRARWQLTHSGLVDQLSAALTTTSDNPTDNWAELARLQLAVRLAQDSGLTELAEPLLDVAETYSWPVALRQSAAKAAMRASPTIAAPRLRALLATLTPTAPSSPGQGVEPAADQPEWDNITELVGTLLQVLWPDHLQFTDALPHIRPVTTRHFLGMYLIQVRQFPRDVTEQDLPALLTHTEEILRAHGVKLDQPDPETTDQHDAGNPAMTPAHIFLLENDHARSLRDFVAPIVDRILESDQAEGHLARIARILLWFLPSSERMPLPIMVDLVDATGTEPASTTILASMRPRSNRFARSSVPRDRPVRLLHRGSDARWRWRPAHRARGYPGARAVDGLHFRPGLCREPDHVHQPPRQVHGRCKVARSGGQAATRRRLDANCGSRH